MKTFTFAVLVLVGTTSAIHQWPAQENYDSLIAYGDFPSVSAQDWMTGKPAGNSGMYEGRASNWHRNPISPPATAVPPKNRVIWNYNSIHNNGNVIVNA